MARGDFTRWLYHGRWPCVGWPFKRSGRAANPQCHSGKAAFTFRFAAPVEDHLALHFSDYLYYTFVSFTTIGYGDIVPRAAYTKSLAMLIGVSGQIYVAVIIAMLIGKYARGTGQDNCKGTKIS
jgi:ion channel